MISLSTFRSQIQINLCQRRLKLFSPVGGCLKNEKLFSTEPDKKIWTKKKEKDSTIDPPSIKEEQKPDLSFATMMRRSKLMQIGDPNGRIVIARIVYTTEDDLYIDFGGKFSCVCKRPKKDGELYRRNTLVVIRLHDLELSSRFLGSGKDLTLLEADATLLGLARRIDRK